MVILVLIVVVVVGGDSDCAWRCWVEAAVIVDVA